MNTPPARKNLIKRVQQALVSSSQGRWMEKAVGLTLFSLVVTHLSTREGFPGSASYRFPIEGFLSSMLLCIMIGIITELNFKVYRKKYFSKKVEVTTLVWFMSSTLGYITIGYIPLNIILNKITGGQTEFYYILIGLLITLLISLVLISLLYAQEVYQLYKLSVKEGEITIESGATVTKLTYENIACFYSQNKIVYAVQNDGKSLSTDFTLNELEEKINDQLFFRANRQMIIHKNAVAQMEKIENGKLLVRLQPKIKDAVLDEINISRYKRKEFLDWWQQ